jgi:hypothetical protein
MIKKFWGIIPLALLAQGCFLFGEGEPKPDGMTSFSAPSVFPLDNPALEEASGLAPSRNFPTFLYTHEDNGARPSRLHLISPKGRYNTFWEMPIQIRDWEDIAVGPGPMDGTSYVYLGNIGDNLEQYPYVEIFRFPEPTQRNGRIGSVETIQFQYSDGRPYDAEALMIDPKTKDLYVITKRQLNVRVYKLAYPQKVNEMNTAQFLFTLPYFFITAGDISSDGREILLKNYDAIYYWKVRENETIEQALQRPRDVAPAYTREPQGESICFDIAQTGFFTLSEAGGQTGPIPLYFYPKK